MCVDPTSAVVRIAVSEKHGIAALSIPSAVAEVPNHPLVPSWMQSGFEPEQAEAALREGAGGSGTEQGHNSLLVSLPDHCQPLLPVYHRDKKRRACVAVHRQVLWAPLATRRHPRRPDLLCGVPLGRVSAGRVVAQDEERMDWARCVLEVLQQCRELSSLAARSGVLALQREALQRLHSVSMRSVEVVAAASCQPGLRALMDVPAVGVLSLAGVMPVVIASSSTSGRRGDIVDEEVIAVGGSQRPVRRMIDGGIQLDRDLFESMDCFGAATRADATMLEDAIT